MAYILKEQMDYSPETPQRELVLASSKIFREYFPEARVIQAYVILRKSPRKKECVNLKGLDLEEFERVLNTPSTEGFDDSFAIQYGYSSEQLNVTLCVNACVNALHRGRKIKKRYIELEIKLFPQVNKSFYQLEWDLKAIGNPAIRN